MEVRERSQVKHDSCDWFGISAQGLLSKVDRMESDVEGLIVRRLCSGGRRRRPQGCIVHSRMLVAFRVSRGIWPRQVQTIGSYGTRNVIEVIE